MAVEVRKKEGEATGSLIYRFTKKIQQSGVLRESKKRKFHDRAENRSQRRKSAIYREAKKKEVLMAKKMGQL